MEVYVKFLAIGTNIDKLWNSKVVNYILNQITAHFDGKWAKEIESNVSDNWANLAIILMDIPGCDCETIGTRIGIAVRRLTSIYI